MSVRDREVLEVLRDKPELLAIADAVSEVERVPRRSSRVRRTVAAVVLAGAALFAFALVSPWERDDGKGVLLERALAAIDTRGPVLHGTFQISSGERVDLATRRATPLLSTVDVWYDKRAAILRAVLRRDGRVVSDRTGLGEEAEFEGGLMRAFADAADFYRDALRDGTARVKGTGRWRGKLVYWLELFDQSQPRSLEVGVAQETLEPLVLRSGDFEIGLLKLEYVSQRDAHFGRPGPLGSLLSGSGVTQVPAPSLSPAEARTALGVAAAWAGPRVKDLALRTIEVEDVFSEMSGRPRVEGKQLRLIYGERVTRPGSGAVGVEIVELPAENPVWESLAEEAPPRAGFADLTSSQMQGESGGPETRWTAVVRIAGVWASVEASSRELAIAAARALRPIPPG